MEEIITLDYGSGGKKTSQLIEEILLPAFQNDALGALSDGAVLSGEEKLVFSTDSFVVNPLFFPGGNIGKLSVCGTVNDLSMSGGIPKYLSLSFILEEGFPMDSLKKIVASIRDTAKSCGVQIVTGDTKVVERGKGDGIYINTAGIGFLRCPGLGTDRIREGDAVLLSGTAGDHSTAVMLARDGLLSEGGVFSDCQPLHLLAQKLFELGPALRVLRDPTRGGIATTLNEFVENGPFTIELEEEAIPVKPAVAGACDILGLDPLYCANEGKLLAIVSADQAQEALARMRSLPEGADAAIIGQVSTKAPGRVLLKTCFGGTRILTKLTGSQLPRIC